VDTAPRDRPAKHTVLRELCRELAASPETVLAALPGTRYDSLVVVQGDWWYRGEYRVVAHESGSLLTLTIVNVAQSAHWTAPIAGRRELADASRALDELVAGL
jgi:hypothetical protein